MRLRKGTHGTDELGILLLHLLDIPEGHQVGREHVIWSPHRIRGTSPSGRRAATTRPPAAKSGRRRAKRTAA